MNVDCEVVIDKMEKTYIEDIRVKNKSIACLQALNELLLSKNKELQDQLNTKKTDVKESENK